VGISTPTGEETETKMPVIPLHCIKPATTSIDVHVELPPETAKLIAKFCALNQDSRNTHGPMTTEKPVTMLLEDVAAAVKDNTTWQGGHMSLVLSEHGYRT
jgi:hypothetical protein